MNQDGESEAQTSVPAMAPPAQALHAKPAAVMDVVPPRSEAPVETVQPPEVAQAPDQPELAKEPDSPDQLIATEAKHHRSKPPATQPAKEVKHPASGVGLAVTATVVIVLGLSALIVFAYLQSR